MIDIKDLEAFIAILDSGSISKAASDLGLTQPALSLKLKKIETELGVKLFQRTSRNVLALESAKTIEAKVRDIIAKLDVLKESLAESLADVRGNVRVGCVMGWFDSLLVPALSQLSRQAPLVRMRLHVDQTANLVQMVAQGALDFAIVAQPFEKTDGVNAQHLIDEELVLVGRNLPTGTQRERARALLARPWIILAHPDPLVEKYFQEQFSQKFPWEIVQVPVILDHIRALPAVVRSIPDALAVLPSQVFVNKDSLGGLELGPAVQHQNGVYLIWRADGLELRRFQIVRDVLASQAKALSKLQ